MKEDIREQIKTLSDIKEKIHNEHKGKVVSIYISGSHLYGWSSEDSDIDYRGIFQYNPRELMGRGQPKEVIDLYKNDKILDVSLWEIKKVIDRAFDGNCNIMEEMNAQQVYRTDIYGELKTLLNKEWNLKGIYYSYRGLADNNYRKFIMNNKEERSVKKYLYVFRGILAGRYALDNSALQPDMNKLVKYYRVPELKELLDIKKEGKEKDIVPETVDNGRLDQLYLEQLTKLDNKHDEMFESGTLTTISKELKDEINEWLKSTRMEYR